MHFTSYLSIALTKILPHSKTMKHAKKLSVFGENDSRCLSNFLQTHIFWNLDHISRIYYQINYRNIIWFPKVKTILIMAVKVLFFHFFFPKNTRTLMPLIKAVNAYVTHFKPTFHFYIPWKRQEAKDFMKSWGFRG